MDNSKEDQIFLSLVQELRRGTIVLSVLSQLNKPQYGYSLVTCLVDKGLTIEPGTLYPLLRRLEKQELLVSNWDTKGTKPRKYYQISEFGETIYKRLSDHWLEVVSTMKNFIKERDI